MMSNARLFASFNRSQDRLLRAAMPRLAKAEFAPAPGLRATIGDRCAAGSGSFRVSVHSTGQKEVR